MHHPRVDTAQLTAYFDEETGIAHVIYRGILTPQTATQVYQWSTVLMQAPGVESVRGFIHDFREVTHFKGQTLSTVRIESQKLSTRLDVSRMAVALLVKNALQEQIVRIAIQRIYQQPQKQIVYCEEEAAAFIDRWNSNLPRPDAGVATDGSPGTS